jgi:hypothetical protein
MHRSLRSRSLTKPRLSTTRASILPEFGSSDANKYALIEMRSDDRFDDFKRRIGRHCSVPNVHFRLWTIAMRQTGAVRPSRPIENRNGSLSE